MVFFNLWAWRATNSTLASKFGGLAQKWGKEREGQWKIMGGKGTRIEYGRWDPAWGGDKWRPHGERTYSTAAYLFLHRQAKLVDCSSLVFYLKQFVLALVNYNSLVFLFLGDYKKDRPENVSF